MKDGNDKDRGIVPLVTSHFRRPFGKLRVLVRAGLLIPVARTLHNEHSCRFLAVVIMCSDVEILVSHYGGSGEITYARYAPYSIVINGINSRVIYRQLHRILLNVERRCIRPIINSYERAGLSELRNYPSNQLELKI